MVTSQTRLRIGIAAALVAAGALALAVRPVMTGWAWWPFTVTLAAVLVLVAYVAVGSRR